MIFSLKCTENITLFGRAKSNNCRECRFDFCFLPLPVYVNCGTAIFLFHAGPDVKTAGFLRDGAGTAILPDKTVGNILAWWSIFYSS
jgi:hypothetical protein